MDCRTVKTWPKVLMLVLAAYMGFVSEYCAAQGRFSGYEIRVIRPRFMIKRNKVELAGQGTLIMNQPFIYSLMATGLLDYHFSELVALELGGSFGASFDKEDKRILEDEFDIKTQILRTQYIFSGGVIWTPAYGKTQLANGQVVYFDTFLTGALGMTGIDYTYEQCGGSPSSSDDEAGEGTPQPARATKGYLTAIIGLGQKFFLDKDLGFRWDVRDHLFQYDPADGSCFPDEPSGSKKLHQNVTLQLGASTFF